MKILYLLGSLNRGGAETLVYDVYNNAVLMDAELYLAHRKKGTFYSDFKKITSKLFYISNNPLSILFKLFFIVKRNKIDVIHTHQFIDAVYTILISYLLNLKVVYTVHGFDYLEKGFSKLLLKFALKNSSKNIFVSEYQKTYYVDRFNLNENFQVTIYNGIDNGKLIVESTIRQEFDIAENELLLGMVGNFVPGRDHFTVCRFLNILKSEKITFKFLFVGYKSETTPQLYDLCLNYCIENDLMGNVLFLGSRSDVPSILNALDAYIYSTDYDTFGISVIEAMFVGRPIFVNDWPVMKEISLNGEMANLYKSKDEYDLLEKFKLFLSNRNDFDSKSNRIKEFANANFNINNHIEKLNQFYKNLN